MQHSDDVIANTNYTAPIDARQFAAAAQRYPLLVVNYYAPWCPFCQRLAPTWNTVMDWAHKKYPVSDGRIRIASVDCTKEEARPASAYVSLPVHDRQGGGVPESSQMLPLST